MLKDTWEIPSYHRPHKLREWKRSMKKFHLRAWFDRLPSRVNRNSFLLHLFHNSSVETLTQAARHLHYELIKVNIEHPARSIVWSQRRFATPPSVQSCFTSISHKVKILKNLRTNRVTKNNSSIGHCWKKPMSHCRFMTPDFVQSAT